MKKYILPFMSIAMLMAISSCSSSDDEVAENSAEGKLVQMTFTATQESNVGTRTALDNKNVIWKEGDKISVFDGVGTNYNHEFSLSSGNGSTTGSFNGGVYNQNTTFYAVYPYTVGAKLEVDTDTNKDYVSGITLPSTQTAYENSFDPNAALMIAKSSDNNTFNFLNVVSLVKVKIEFACKSIVLNANDYIAGTGKLYWDATNPSISFTSNTSKSIVLKPQEGQDEIAAGTYYIAVKPGELTSGWSISFTSTDYNVYTREARSEVTFNRGKIRSIGTFNAETTSWTHTSRGNIVRADQEVDMGEFTIGDKKYRVIFANANLTASGLAEEETDFGDYFAWGATKPWYSSKNEAWENGKEGGYIDVNAPFYDSGKYDEDNIVYSNYNKENELLKPEHDAANNILKGQWQIPTNEIWKKLYEYNGTSVEWGSNGNFSFETKKDIKGMRITRKDNVNNSIFLPLANYYYSIIQPTEGVGYYWSNTSSSDHYSYRLRIPSNGEQIEPNNPGSRFYGFSIRPVRLVELY